MLTGGTGQASHTPDQRITDVSTLPAGPFQLTNGATFTYDSYAASPVHRFYQMWQQLNCNAAAFSFQQSVGLQRQSVPLGRSDVGAGTNGVTQPANFSTEYSSTATTTGEGSSALGFYNVQQGDVPYFKSLVEKYAMSDNFHQSVNGGTGANHIMLGHADAIWFSDGNGHPLPPPNGVQVFTGTPDAGTVNEIENPNPAPGTNNWYTEDGYGESFNAGFPPPYSIPRSTAADPTAIARIPRSPASSNRELSAVAASPDQSELSTGPLLSAEQLQSRLVRQRQKRLHRQESGQHAVHDSAILDTEHRRQSQRRKISWKYYGDQWNNYVNDPYQLNYGTPGPTTDEYCNICNPFQYDTSIMSNPAQVAAHIQDSVNLYADIANGTLPAVSFVKPSGWVDGHPSSSKLNLFEGFVQKIVDQVEASPYANDTVIFIT